MITDGKERDTGWAGSDKTEEGVGVVHGSVVEQIRHRFGECSHRQEHHLAGYPA